MDVKNQSEEDKNIMIFQKRPRKSVDNNFKIDNAHIEIVQQYTYLGARLTPTGNSALTLEHLKEKAHMPSSVDENIVSLDVIPIPHPRFFTQ